MAATQLFTAETNAGFSGAVAVSGLYTVHARGDFDKQAGTVLRAFVSPTGAEDYTPFGELQFYQPSSKNVELEGSIKFKLSNPGSSAGVSLWIEGPI